MSEFSNISLDMIYRELKSIKKGLTVVENALIPVEKLTNREVEEHKTELKDALREKTKTSELKGR